MYSAASLSSIDQIGMHCWLKIEKEHFLVLFCRDFQTVEFYEINKMAHRAVVQ